MKDYNIRQMQKLALKYFPYNDGLLGHMAKATGDLIFLGTGINFADCCIKFLVFSEREGVILSIEEARDYVAFHEGNEEAILLGMLSQMFIIYKFKDTGLVSERLRRPCQRYFDALFAMAAKRKIDLVKLVDKKLTIYSKIK